jgi:hypothetical protein
MQISQKLKKNIAKEILLFFAAAALLTLVWCLIVINNKYHTSKSKSLNEELALNTLQLENLPTDKIKDIYDKVKQHLIVFYQTDKDPLGIRKKDGSAFIWSIEKYKENEFLKSFPDAKILETHINGYMFRPLKNKTTSDGLPIFQKDPLGILKDSVCEFEFVPFEKFKELTRRKDYITNFHKTFYDELKLGNLLDFEAKVKDGLNFNSTIDIQRSDLTLEIELIKTSIDNSQASIWSYEKRTSFILYTTLILLLILYPIRLCYLLLKWSLRTVKQPDK